MKFSASSVAILLIAFAVLATPIVAEQAQRRCKALVLQSGGDLGAYEVGALKGMYEALPAGSLEYDVISGISVGAINALGISQYPIGTEGLMVDLLLDFWRNITSASIYKQWPGSYAQGLLAERGVFDTSNERDLLTSKAVFAPHRKLNIGVANLKTGQLERFNETHSLAEIIESVMASSAVPFMFPFQVIGGEIYVDGGTVQTLDYSGAINRCLEIVDDESLVDVDSIFVQHSAEVKNWASTKHTTFEVYQRSNQISSFSDTYREFDEAKTYHPTVNFRHLIKPSVALPNPKAPFTFNPVQMEGMIQQGISDAKAIIAAGETTEEIEEFDDLLDDLKQEETAQNRKILKEKILERIPFYNKLVRSM